MAGLVLGVDGGGTKTVAWLASSDAPRDGEPLGRGAAGPGNPRSVGFEVALANLDSAIAATFADAGVPRGTVRAACLALAGADRPVERTRIEGWCAGEQIADQTVVTNDAEPLLAAASPDCWGAVILAGTGSMAFGRNRAGQTARSGGWGYLLGDEGSGYAIAIAGLRAAARAADGRGEETRLLTQFQQRLQVSSPQGLIEAIYRPDMLRRQIADLAEVVLALAKQGDQAAQQIVSAAASDLADLVQNLVAKLQLPANQYPLAMAGGILVHFPELRTNMLQHLTDSPAAPGSVTLEPDPVRGAVILAQRALKKGR